jgi:serine/threonine protein kinase
VIIALDGRATRVPSGESAGKRGTMDRGITVARAWSSRCIDRRDMQVQPVGIGSIVARRYRATRRIATGAMGEVWEGVHVELGHRVALKVLRKEALGCREMVRRFQREAFLLARIQSEHVVRVIDWVGNGRHGPVLVMELVEGPTFSHQLHHESPTLDEIVHVAIDVLHGLRAMHAANVIHRDVKPGNVVLRRLPDGSRRAVLVDLGVGRLGEETYDLFEDDDVPPILGEEITRADRVVGTLEYMPPEQILSSQNVDATVDVYAVGAMLFRAVSGSHPFGDKRGLELLREKVHKRMPPLKTGRRDAVGKKLEAIVARAVEFKAAHRFPTADAMLLELESLAAQMRSARATLAEIDDADAKKAAPPRSRTRHRKAVVALVAACAMVVGACSTDVGWSPTVARAAAVLAR